MRSILVVTVLALVACNKDPVSSPPTTATTGTTASTPSITPSAPSAPASAPSAPTAAAAPAPAELAVGKAAPDFKVKAHDGVDLELAKLKGKPVVVYFYPKDETPGCTKEACSFRDAWKELGKSNVVLVGVSADSVESHKAFAKHHELPFHLVSDADGSLAKTFGVPTFGRQSFVIDTDGKVKKIYRSVDVTKHAAEILADLKS